MKNAFDDMPVFLASNMGNAQGGFDFVGRPANGANRVQEFEVSSSHLGQPPMMTVGSPGGRILPTGLGMGATQEE
jgi:hypothetical protein